MIIGPRAVDCTIGLARGLGIWPRVMLISYALGRSSGQFVAVCKGVGLIGFMFEGPRACPKSHTIGVSDYGGGSPVLVLPFVVRRSADFFFFNL